MSRFQPTRASSPSKLSTLADTITHASDTSHATNLSVPELKGLSLEDIEILDAVIQRAGPSTNTFLTAFKAYNDVLTDRGIDPHEVVYYGKLLKLGTLKGRNWGEKWKMVKEQYAYGNRPPSPTKQIRKKAGQHMPLKVTKVSRPPLRESESETLASDTGVGGEFRHDIPPHKSSLPSPSPVRSELTSGSVDLELGGRSLLLKPSQPNTLLQRSRQAWNPVLSGSSDGFNNKPPSLPPSYRSAFRDVSGSRPSYHADVKTAKLSETLTQSTAARQAVARARQQKGSVINEDDAWKNIRMERDEKNAEQFRDDRLVERCWDVWKQGYTWTITTNRQIDEARDNLILRLNFQRWRTAYLACKAFEDQISQVADMRRLRTMLKLWRIKLREKRQLEWRRSMRSKMRIVKEKHESKLIKYFWAKWRQSHKLQLSDQHYTDRLLLRFFIRWKQRLDALGALDDIAEDVSQHVENTMVERCWKYWRRAATLQTNERLLIESIDVRIIVQTMGLWKQRIHNHHIAEQFHALSIMKRAIHAWLSRIASIRVMENRANKHLARQDDLLLRAVHKVWRARERGVVLENARTTRLFKKAWSKWKTSFKSEKSNEEYATSFSKRANSHLLKNCLQMWYQVHTTHKNSQGFAVQYHTTQVLHKSLLQWRIVLREKLKMAKMARLAVRYFATRSAWRIWIDKHDDIKRESRLKELQNKKLEKYFTSWLHKTRQVVHRKLAEVIIKDMVSKRIMRNTLEIWTNSVIELKLRELDITQRHNNKHLTLAFQKWRRVSMRHAEELSLMESYLFVKREEMIHRVFHRWAATARAARHLRTSLQRKEDEMRIARLSSVWDKWREKFVSEKLRPMEYEVIIQTQRSLLFGTFGKWHSKTKSLPAIRFHAIRYKYKYFQQWKDAMPRALQAKAAREQERIVVLTRYFNSWLRAYKAKIALKAVARARYLRLPTAPLRQTGISSLAPIVTSRFKAGANIPRRSNQDSNDRDNVSSTTKISPTPFTNERDVINLLSAKSDPGKLQSPRRRDPSPARTTSSIGDYVASKIPKVPPVKAGSSITSGDGGGNNIWLELHGIPRKPRSKFRTNREEDET